MMCGRCIILCLSLAAASLAEARSLGRLPPADKDHSLAATQVSQATARQHISPSLDPESSKKFFKKDYPADGRPAVDVLHFKHPYPVVQDSGEFDSDYVKDENSDNGHFKAQQEYDRLRHKLAQEKKEAAKALEKKKEEEQELKNALEKYNKEVRDKQQADAAKQSNREDKHKEVEEKKPEKPAQTEKGWSWSWPFSWPFSWPKSGGSDAPAAEPVVKEGTGVRSATKATEKSIDNLKECQDELAAARDKLKKLMDEVDEAKGKQSKASAALDTATQEHLKAKKVAEDFHDKTSTEKAEHAIAEAAYLKQKARVDKLKADLDAAAAKVKAHRDAEDAGGGVYNTHTTKSLSISLSPPWALGLMLVAAACLDFA